MNMTNGQKRKMKLQVVSVAILAKAQELTKLTLEHKQVASETLKQFLIDVQALTRPMAEYAPGKKVNSNALITKIFGSLDVGTKVTGAEVFNRAAFGEGWEKRFVRRGVNISVKVPEGGSFSDTEFTFNGFDSTKVLARKEKSKARRAARKAKAELEASAVSA